MTLQLHQVTVERAGRTLLGGASLEVDTGELVVVVGPNGAGKSTLLRAAAGADPPAAGEVRYRGVPATALSPLELAQRRAVLTQQPPIAFGFTAREVVEMGRYPFGERGGRVDVVRDTMEALDVAAFANRPFASLSGGEQQRVQWARLFAQARGAGVERPSWLLLDEPTSALDAGRALALLQRLRAHVDSGVGALLVLHDLNLALRVADRVVVVVAGRVVADARPVELIDADRLGAWFDVRFRVVPDAGAPLPLLVPTAPRDGALPPL